jgi:hypothetical protein
MKKIIPLLLILFVLKASAQDSTNKNPGIITKKTFGPYRMDGRRISGMELKKEIFKVPDAALLYKKANTSRILGYSFAVPLIIYAITDNQNNYHWRRDSTYRLRRGFTIGAVLSGIAANYFLFHSISLYKKAIRARNSGLKTIY